LSRIIAGFIIAVSFLPIRNKVETIIDKVFFKEKLEYFQSLHNLSQILVTILDLKKLIETIVKNISQIMKVENICLLLKDDETEKYQVKSYIGFNDQIKRKKLTIKSELVNLLIYEKTAVIKNTLIEQNINNKFSNVINQMQQFESEIVIPFFYNKQLIGILSLGQKKSGDIYSMDDIQVLTLLASQSGISIQNALLYKKSLIKERMERDLQIGAEIQKYFLPQKIEKIKDLDIDTHYSPAEFIGGDYYDIAKMGKNKYGIIIVDISGHGSSAAIVMSVISFIFHSVIERIKGTSELMAILNKRLHDRLQAEKYATGIFIIYDSSNGRFEYTNAGHHNLILYKKSKDKIIELKGGKGMPIGVFKDSKYKTGKFTLKRRDILLLQTDGVYEAMNNKHEQFSIDRVKNEILKYKDSSPDKLNKRIINRIIQFRGDRSQQDDITLITIKKVI